MKLDWAYWITGKREQSHKHVFDSRHGIERYGDLIVLHCSCGVGRVYGPLRTSRQPAPLIPMTRLRGAVRERLTQAR